MRRHQFEAYLDKVFDFSGRVAAMPEGRQSPRHGWTKVFDAVFLGAAIQIPHLHRVEAECRQGVLRQRIGKLSEDTMRYALERQDPALIFALGCEVARRLKRNGVLGSSWARGRIVAAVDGIEICSSFLRCCDVCMEREVGHRVDGQLRKDTQYYHRIVAVVLVSTAFPIPLGLRFQKDGETEVTCAVALLHDLDRQLGRRFLDVLVADALYLQKGFVDEIEDLGLDWVITLKENQPELLAEAQRLTEGQPETLSSTPEEELQLWHAPEVYWPVADRSVRVVKTVRVQKGYRVKINPGESPEGTPKKKKTKEPVRQESTNHYASNLDLGSIPPSFIYQLGRSRWRVDTEVFQTLTTQAHLKQPSVHQTRALVVLTMMRVLAYTLMLVFYHRQVVSHARQDVPTFSEMARLLAYLFLTATLGLQLIPLCGTNPSARAPLGAPRPPVVFPTKSCFFPPRSVANNQCGAPVKPQNPQTSHTSATSPGSLRGLRNRWSLVLLRCASGSIVATPYLEVRFGNGREGNEPLKS